MILLQFVVLIGCGGLQGYAQAPLNSEVTALAQRLSKITAYEAYGTVKVTHSEAAMVGVQAQPNSQKVKLFKFHVWSKGLSTKEQFDQLNSDGGIITSETYYESEKQVATVAASRYARISSKKPGSKLGIRNVNPIFMEYSFLDRRTTIDGIPSFSSPMIDTGETLTGLLSKPPPAKDSGDKVTLNRDGRDFLVTFANPITEGKLTPQKIEMSDPSNNSFITVDVLSKVAYPILGEGAKEIRMTTNAKMEVDQPPVLLAVWEFGISKLIVNAPIRDEEVEFDPATVDSIWDNDKKVNITVSK